MPYSSERTIFSANVLHDYLRRRWKEAGVTLREGERPGVSIPELIKDSAIYNESLTNTHLDLWIAVYDEFASWLISLATAVQPGPQYASRGLSDFDRAVTLLLMRLVSDSLAIRLLIVGGHEAVARNTVRSTGEHAEVLMAIIDCPDLAVDFCKTKNTNEANRFWKAHLSKNKIRIRMRKLWLDFFENDAKAAKAFSNWGNREYSELSAISHPSFMGCSVAAFPQTLSASEEKWLPIFGLKSLASIYTIQTYISYLFPALLAIGEFPFETKPGSFSTPRVYDQNSNLHTHIKFGREVLASLVISLNHESNFAAVYPSQNEGYPGEDEADLRS